MVAAFQQLAENGQKFWFPELIESDAQAAKIGIKPSGDQQTRIPKEDAVGEAIADNKIERSAPTASSNVELWRKQLDASERLVARPSANSLKAAISLGIALRSRGTPYDDRLAFLAKQS